MAPPKRMSDILASSSIDTRIASTSLPATAPCSSEGPTLPVISAASEHSTKVAESGKKRKRPALDTSDPNKTGPESRTQAVKEGKTNHPSLYEPWVLLPARERKDVENRGTEQVATVVFNKNQNVKSGINKLKNYLGALEVEKNSKLPAALKGDDGVIAVSAQGEGTVKLVGIVDMARRIVGETKRMDGEKEDGVKWFLYTVLSSVVVSRSKSAGPAAQNDASDAQASEADVMDVDGGDVAVNETQEDSKEEDTTKTVPVLTIWMTRKKIASFKDSFGEQELVVYKVQA